MDIGIGIGIGIGVHSVRGRIPESFVSALSDYHSFIHYYLIIHYYLVKLKYTNRGVGFHIMPSGFQIQDTHI